MRISQKTALRHTISHSIFSIGYPCIFSSTLSSHVILFSSLTHLNCKLNYHLPAPSPSHYPIIPSQNLLMTVWKSLLTLSKKLDSYWKNSPPRACMQYLRGSEAFYMREILIKEFNTPSKVWCRNVMLWQFVDPIVWLLIVFRITCIYLYVQYVHLSLHADTYDIASHYYNSPIFYAHHSHQHFSLSFSLSGLFASRKSGFKDYPAIPKELDLVEREDQITFEIGLDEEVYIMLYHV